MYREAIYADRREAGIRLGNILKSKYTDDNVIVLGIPRGGVVVAYEVARVLQAELSVIITKKLPHPLQEELAIGAMAEDGSVYLTELSNSINAETINEIITLQSKEIKSRIKRFRKSKPLPDILNRVVILVDDGIATGSTLVPAIKLCRFKKAAKVIVAAPVSGKNYVSDIADLADEVVIASQPKSFFAVGQVYNDFHNLSDQEVSEILSDFERASNEIRYH